MATRAYPALDALPLSRSPADIRARVELIEKLMERGFVIPGTSRQVGLDALLGLVPLVGDIIAGGIGLWLVAEARALGMPKFTLARMVANVAVDTALGSVPLAGDLFDLLFRSNSRNLKLVRKHLDRHHPQTAIIDAR